MKEYLVCYSLENDIKRGKILKDLEVEKEEIVKEILEKIEQSKYIIVKEDEGDYLIDTSLIRYIRVLDENKLPLKQLVVSN